MAVAAAPGYYPAQLRGAEWARENGAALWAGEAELYLGSSAPPCQAVLATGAAKIGCPCHQTATMAAAAWCRFGVWGWALTCTTPVPKQDV